jgi:hypothetical protein
VPPFSLIAYALICMIHSGSVARGVRGILPHALAPLPQHTKRKSAGWLRM